MALTSEFKDAVQNQNKVRVRIMLKDSLLLDPSGDNFQQMLDYAKVQIPSLWMNMMEKYSKTADQRDETYLNEQMVAVVNNFSEDRIELLQIWFLSCISHSSQHHIQSIQKRIGKMDYLQCKRLVWRWQEWEQLPLSQELH